MFEILFLIFVIWQVVPFLILLKLPVPTYVKGIAAVSFAKAAVKGWLTFVPSIVAPIVTPLALIQTAWGDDKLPFWARWWDNDVNLNGDIPEYWPVTYQGDCYYAKGHHPRSFWARYMWVGWRNRASALSQKLGHTWTDLEKMDAQTWGDPLTGRDHEGWSLNRKGSVYQLYVIKKLGPVCLRINWGHKVWPGVENTRPVANVVNISFSLIKWTGK